METQARPRRPSDHAIRTILQILAPGLALVALWFAYLVLIGAFRDPENTPAWLQAAALVFVVGDMAGGVLFLAGMNRLHPILQMLAPGGGVIILFLGTLLLFDAFRDRNLDILLSLWLPLSAYGFAAGVLVGGVLLLGSRGRRGNSRTGRALGWAATVLGVPALVFLYLLTAMYAIMTSEMWW